jgi:hypothetical protein
VTKQTNSLAGAVEAPKLADLIRDPASMALRQDDVVFARLSPLAEDLRVEPDRPQGRLIGVSEAAALSDLDAKMGELISIFDETPHTESAVRIATSLRQDVRFLGRTEREAGARALAQNWLDRLDASPTEEVFVAVPDNFGESFSSSYVFGVVMEQLVQLDPDAERHVIGFNYRDWLVTPETRRRAAASGIVLLDDWAVSGSQMGMWTRELGTELPEVEDVEIQLLCATDEQLADGIDGTPCRSYFVRPHTDAGDLEQVSITGAHGLVDHGFSKQVSDVYGQARNIVEREHTQPRKLPYPLLAAISSVYNPERYKHTQIDIDSMDHVRALIDQEQRYSRWAKAIVELSEL